MKRDSLSPSTVPGDVRRRHRAHQIWQIFYNEATRQANDPGFFQLDNLSNPRPDWSEYWPIRHFLRGQPLEEDTYYGFLSPKFRLKTGLGATEVHAFLEACDEDIVAFSPYYDQAAFALNVFEQGASNHADIWPTFIAAFGLIDPAVDIRQLVMTSQDTIFCNFFAAKKGFWDTWFSECEKLFALCEANDTELARRLNAPVNHAQGANPAKVFVIERVVSFLLATRRQWRVRVYNPNQLPCAISPVARFKKELPELDALKMAYRETGYLEFLQAFVRRRTELIQSLGG